MTEMPKPTEAHRKLDCFAGHWTGQERMFPSPWDPQGSTAVGRCNNRVAVDGFVIVHDYEQEREGAINFHGHGVFTYGTAEKSYVLYWWDSMGMATNVFKGNFEGNAANALPGSSWDQPGDMGFPGRQPLSVPHGDVHRRPKVDDANRS
jgi:hypothetical protein